MKSSIILGSLILASTASHAQNTPTAEQLQQVFMQRMDSDQNGVVTQDEYLKPYITQFEYLDRDRNGMINANEAKAFAQQMLQRQQ